MSEIYILCEDSIYKYAEDYILSFKPLYTGIILYKINGINMPIINPKYIYIFVQTIPDSYINNINIYLLNIEQLSRPFYLDYIVNMSKRVKTIDYSRANMLYYDCNKFLPYQVNYAEVYNYPKTRDICILAYSPCSTRRANIVNEFRGRGQEIDVITGWKKERDEKLFTYKILINIGHSDEYRIFESIRCDRCIHNQMIVISEKKQNEEL